MLWTSTSLPFSSLYTSTRARVNDHKKKNKKRRAKAGVCAKTEDTHIAKKCFHVCFVDVFKIFMRLDLFEERIESELRLNFYIQILVDGKARATRCIMEQVVIVVAIFRYLQNILQNPFVLRVLVLQISDDVVK